jgi:hypothetical protein
MVPDTELWRALAGLARVAQRSLPGRREPLTHAVHTDPGVKMLLVTATAASSTINTSGLVAYLQTLFGPLFLGIVGIVAIFFLFTREVIRFVQFFVLAVVIAVIFYVPGIVQSLALGIAHALGVH